MSPVYQFVRSLGDYYTMKEAAEMLDVSHWTLRNYIRSAQDDMSPSKTAQYGQVRIYLYTDDDIDRIRENLVQRHKVKDFQAVGMDSRYSKAERAVRTQLRTKRKYWKTALNKAEFMEDTDKIKLAESNIEELQAKLDEM